MIVSMKFIFDYLQFLRRTLAWLSGLLGKQIRMNVREDTALRNSDMSKQFVEFLVVTDCELQMTRDDTGLLVVTSSVSSQFENFSCEVFEDSCEVDRRTSSYSFF